MTTFALREPSTPSPWRNPPRAAAPIRAQRSAERRPRWPIGSRWLRDWRSTGPNANATFWYVTRWTTARPMGCRDCGRRGGGRFRRINVGQAVDLLRPQRAAVTSRRPMWLLRGRSINTRVTPASGDQWSALSRCCVCVACGNCPVLCCEPM